MGDSSVHFPVNFRDLPHTRALSALTHAAVPYLMWQEWAAARAEWRMDEPMLHTLIPDYVRAAGVNLPVDESPITLALRTGFMQARQKREQDGFVLAGFWEINRHLSPHYLSPQQMGGISAKAARIVRESSVSARERLEVAVLNGKLQHVNRTAECEAAMRLLVRLFRSSGCSNVSKVRVPTREEVAEIHDTIIDRHSEAEIVRVMEYLYINRENGEISKDPYVLIKRFPELLDLAHDTRV